MKKQIIYRVSRKDFLTDILLKNGFNGQIPSGYFIDKTEPGIGATHTEITDQTRNSIILEPFKTVIEVKKEKFGDTLCAVYEGVHVQHIYEYLKSDIYPKKIMSTPESFGKVITALKRVAPDYKEHYFMLIDECEKLVQDCLYRNAILNPLKEFFLFKNKSLISATPILGHIAAFKDFERLKIVPKYRYKKDLKLMVTNNIRYGVRNIIANASEKTPYFIFTNCKKTILYLTQLEMVKDNYSVFCADNLYNRFFKDQQVHNVKNSVITQEYSKFNFFTSRFFSAVDMHLPKGVKAHVLIITNMAEAKHSIIDPQIDAVQIYGRCRNKAVKSITHLTDLNTYYASQAETTLLEDSQEEIQLVNLLLKLKGKHSDFTIQRSVDAIINKSHASVILNKDKTTNEFFTSNFLSKQRLMLQYASGASLLKEYQKVNFFKTKKHEFSERFSDRDRLRLLRIKGRERRKYIADLIDQTIEASAGFNDWENDSLEYSLKLLKEEDALTFNCYMNFGLDFLNEIEFSKNEMQKALFDKIRATHDPLLLIIDRIYAEFRFDVPHYSEDVKSKLQDIYDEFNYQIAPGKFKVAKATDIKEYFDCQLINSKKQGEGLKGSFYRLYRHKSKIQNGLEFLAPNTFY